MVVWSEDGTLSANYNSSLTGGNGGGIYLTGKATMTMAGGTLSGNYAYASTDKNKSGIGFGGGLYVETGAKATLSGGAISGNRVYDQSWKTI